MRYDIYRPLTIGTNKYKKGSLEREILEEIVPIKLERKVKEIEANVVELSLAPKSTKLETCANKVYEKDNSTFKDAISIYSSLDSNKQLFNCEEIVGFNNDSSIICYSCTEIIDNGNTTLIVGGTVTYENFSDKSNNLHSVKLGKWIYDNELIKNYEPLSSFCSSRLETINVYDHLKEIQENLLKEYYIKPEDYVCITAPSNLELKEIEIDNDGEIERQENYERLYKDEFPFLDVENNNEWVKDPKFLLRIMHKISNFLYIPITNDSLYGNFSVLDFIDNFQTLETIKKENSNRKVKSKK